MYIGIDLGGTNIAAGVINSEGKLLITDSIPTRNERDSKEIINDMIQLVETLIRNSGFKRTEFKAIGIGIPGIADDNTGNVVYCVNLNWENISLKEPMETSLQIPVFIGNDATVAGVAEYGIGKMKNYKNGIFLTLGTGVGSGVIIDGKAFTGSHGIGTEIGHMVVGDNFYDCNCGRNGCLETFASATALIKYTEKELNAGRKSTLQESIKTSKLDARMIFDAAKNGDELALESVDRLVKYLAIGISNLINIIDPEIFLLGGGVSKAGDFLLDKIRLEVENNKSFRKIDSGIIQLAELENDAGIIGAAMLGKISL